MEKINLVSKSNIEKEILKKTINHFEVAFNNLAEIIDDIKLMKDKVFMKSLREDILPIQKQIVHLWDELYDKYIEKKYHKESE